MKLITRLDQVSEQERLSWLNLPYSIDIESTGLNFMSDALIGVALYVNNTAYYFCVMHSTGNEDEIQQYLTYDELRFILQPIMSQPDVVASLHNSKFDRHFFERYNMPLLSRVYDTLLAAQLLDENRRNGLKSLASLVDEAHAKYETFVTSTAFPKGSPLNTQLSPFSEYAMRDVIITHKLWLLFREQMRKEVYPGGRSLQTVFNELWSPMVGTLQEMEERGFKINRPYVQQLYNEYSQKVDEYAKEVRIEGLKMLQSRAHDPSSIQSFYWEMVTEDDEVYEDVNGRPVLDIEGIQLPVWMPTPRSKPRKLSFNIGSSTQLVDLVFERDLGLPSHVDLKLTKNGEDSVDVENLTVIKHYLGDKTPSYVDTVLKWRKASKFVNTYLTMFLRDADENDRLHGLFNMAVSEYGAGGTHTGRLSSSQPNLQQIPSRGEIGHQARDAFITDDHMRLIVADYSNMETVLMAHYSEDPVLLTAFAEGLDVHAITACGFNNIPYDKFMEEYKNDNPEYDAMRRTAKTLMFGQSYGMGPKKMQRTLLVQNGQEYDYEEVKRLLQSFSETYQGLTDWKKKVMMFARKNGYVLTMYGRKRRLPQAMSSDTSLRSRAERQAVNAVVQGTCADILFEAMPPIQASFKALGGSILASVHDEMIAEIPVEYAEVGAKIMSNLMVDLVNPKLKCKLKVEAGIGKTWGEAK